MQRSADVADNASSEFEDAGEHQRKLAAERWDNPIIVTTMVEFLETVMSARGTKLRKFHNMADSVIIFDEIQSLPMNTINLFNEIVSFLSKITNSTILLCSATQPLLEKTKRENLLLSEKPDLIAETESYEDKLRRTRIVASAENKSCDELGQIIYQQARKNGNCLAIVNLKKEAREIFQCLERLDVNHEFELIRLSTAMCGRHRTDCLNRIGALLDPGNPKPVICVSTQLIDETRKQHRQEDVITMYLEPNRDDRDYLYGRLLALADNFEESVLRKQGVKDRPTNAIKLMSNFTAKPYTTWGTLWKQLTPYLKSANGGSWFRNEVDDVMALFKEGDFEDNKALSPMFLLGYSCQRRASRRKAQEISQKNNSNN